MKWIRDVDDTSATGYDLEGALHYRANKDAAYSSGLAEFLESAVPVTILGREWLAHPNVNLYLDSTGQCSCDCDFCIAKTKFDRYTIDVDQYIARFKECLRVLHDANPSVQLTGGEPTMNYDSAAKLITAVSDSGLRNPVMNTNGHGLPDLVELLNASNMQHVNISRHHYNDSSNNEIMRASVRDLRDIGRLLRPRVRVQCNMIRDYIDTYGEVMQFIAYAYHHMAADNIAFAQLTPLPRDDYYQDSIIDYVADRQVDVDSILYQIGRDSRFVFEKYRGGVACYYEVWQYMGYDKPVTVLFKFSDNSYLSAIDRMPKYAPDFVLHTDGTLAASWNRGCKVIMGNGHETDLA